MARRVFLSFVEEDLSLVNLFRAQAKAQNNLLEFSDHSVRVPYNSSNADYIRRQIREKISKVSVTICLLGYYTHTSDWVEWEIDKSIELGKGLVGVRLHSSWKDIVPNCLSDASAEVVDWQIINIIHVIEKAAKKAGY